MKKSIIVAGLVTLGVALFTFLAIRFAGHGDIIFKQGEAYAMLQPSTYKAIGLAGGLTSFNGILSVLSLLGLGFVVYRMKESTDVRLLKHTLPLGVTALLFLTFLLTPAFRAQEITAVVVPVADYKAAGGDIDKMKTVGIDTDKLLKTVGENYDWETKKYFTADNPVRPNDFFKNGKKLPGQ